MNRVIAASSIVVVVAFATAFSAAPGIASSGVPTSLVSAINARLGEGAVRLSSVGSASIPEASFGYNVSLSADGTTALVGAPDAFGGGGAYIFHVSDAGSWATTDTPVATLSNSAGNPYDALGYHVELSKDGTTAFVGVPCCSDLPSVDVYHVASESSWASTSTPTAVLSVSHSYDQYWFSVSDDGTTLLMSDPGYNNFAGGGYIFHASSESAWATSSTPDAVLSNTAEPDNDEGVGEKGAISGDGLTVLLTDEEASGEMGGAYVYHVASEGAWSPMFSPTAILSDSSSSEGDLLGHSVALSSDGKTAVLGAFGINDFAGGLEVFHTADAGAWASTSTPTAVLSDPDRTTDDELGIRVSVSADGSTVFTSAVGANGDVGAVEVYHVADANSWASSSTPTAVLTNSAGLEEDLLGYGLGVSSDGSTVLAGAFGRNHFVGAAYVFHVSDQSSWATTSTPNAELTNDALLHIQCVVPKLKKLTRWAAYDALYYSGCGTGGRVTNAYSSTIPVGQVVSQYYKPGTHLAFRHKVPFKLSIGPWHK